MRRWFVALWRRDSEAAATAAIAEHGPIAYAEARRLAREARAAGRYRETRHWSRVAVAITRIEGREQEIGVTGADRYPRL